MHKFLFGQIAKPIRAGQPQHAPVTIRGGGTISIGRNGETGQKPKG